HRFDSKPSSSSLLRSGLRPGFPIEAGVMPLAPVIGANVFNAANALGWRPDSPYADLRRIELMVPANGHHDSSLATHDRLNFGYVTHMKSSPNALLLSTRRAPVA